MQNKHMWDSKVVKVKNKKSGRSFECDSHIAEAIVLLNNKGYRTMFCCEGHPFKYVESKDGEFSKNRKLKYDNTIYFDGGYIMFMYENDANTVYNELNKLGDYFLIGAHKNPSNTDKRVVDWICIDSINLSTYKRSIMRESSALKIMWNTYQEIWNILLTVAKNLPDKKNEYCLECEIMEE